VDPGGLVSPPRRAKKLARSMPADGPEQTATYAYCVVRSARAPDLRAAPRGLPGMGKPRATSPGAGLWLIVADAPLPQYGEPALARLVRDLDAVSRCAVAHSALIAHCARRGPTLPLRLLTLFSNDTRALAEVRGRRRSLERRLTHVAGRAEWGVQARFDAARGQRARHAGGTARPAASGEGPGRRFLERRRRQRDETRGLAADARTAATSLYRALARYADDARQRPPVSVDGQPALLLDAAFLVARTRVGEFRQAVRAHAARVADRGLRVRLTGPWPPYSFVAGRL
jgi:Gas vesicle synthesis protein GvpL/GvpF